MADSPSSYLVLASQRSGSTLLVESLRATGVAGEPQEFFQYLPKTSQAPQPREWFSRITDESILRLLDPLDQGTPDLTPPEIWRAVQTRVWLGRPDPRRDSRAEYHAEAIAHVVTMLREQEKGWRTWFDEEDIHPIEVSYPVLWRNLTQFVAMILEALGLDPRLAPEPVLER